MATVITVHGTGAAGPSKGDQWWQTASDFDDNIRALIESADGKPISFTPFPWDGTNSEKSRRSAGVRLAKTVRALEAAGEPYTLVGHSHGGSVALHAIGTFKVLPHLSRLILVGTPILQTRRSGFFYARLGTFPKIVFLTLLLFFLYYLTMIVEWVHRGERIWWGTATIILAIFPAWVILMWLWDTYGFTARRMSRTNAGIRRHTERIFQMNHEDDEAIACLRSVDGFRKPIFDESAFLTPLTNFSVILAPIALLLILRLVAAIEPIAIPQDARSSSSSVLDGIDYLLAVIVMISSTLVSNLDGSLGVVIFYCVLIASLCLMSVAIHFVLAALFGLLARAATRIANTKTGSQLKRNAYGGDIEGYNTVLSTDAMTATPKASLPVKLATEITETANAGAILTIGKLRRLLASAFGADETNKFDFLAGSLTWDELVHTSYFKVPLFRKLVCLAIARSPGFREAPGIENDKDYNTLVGWMVELQSPRHKQIKKSP